jgi:myosin heavy subunit
VFALVCLNHIAVQGLYSAENMSKYRSVPDKGAMSPHVFATAAMAYNDMIGNKSDQVCVISGESGAGKTEAAKRFVQQLVNVSQGAEYEGLEEKLLELNPVLEAFGNAKTKFNNNSSRFGKYTSVMFNNKGQVKGA